MKRHRLIWFFAICLLIVPNLYAEDSTRAGDSAEMDDFDKFMQEQDALFEEFADSVDAEYRAFVEEQNRKFEEFKAEIEKLWDDIKYSTPKSYVQYTDDYHTRVNVDFEESAVESSALVDDIDTPGALAEAIRKMARELKQVIIAPAKSEPYASDAPPPVKREPPILEEQISDDEGNPVGPENVDEFVAKVVTEENIKVDTILSKDGRRRIKLSVRHDLVPDNLRKRAEKYLEKVRLYSDRNDLDIRLVLAIMHTESYFNPRATSQVPAFGLMQIVPGTGGRDAYQHVYGENKLVSSEYLYNPENNIELGSAYLYVLRFKYLKSISGHQEAYPVMIAAYNGGIGTVCKALTGATKLRGLGSKLKGMSADDITARLMKNLPARETRDYLKHVIERMALYDEWAD